MFDEQSFAVMTVPGLEERMAVIRSEIQPIFQSIGDQMSERLSKELDQEFYVHIAQHRRRTVYAPENTWAAISPGKRGYKMAPHFQVGIWPEYVFVYLSMIDQPKGKTEMAERLVQKKKVLLELPKDMVISKDHTQPEYFPLTEKNLAPALDRFRKVKKSEFEIGRVFTKESRFWTDPQQALTEMLTTIDELLPIYRLVSGA